MARTGILRVDVLLDEYKRLTNDEWLDQVAVMTRQDMLTPQMLFMLLEAVIVDKNKKLEG